MARITRLKLWGWMPFADAYDIQLPAGPIAVVARYRANPRRSNWAGKTALMEAITWALFGVHRKRLDDGVINNQREECGVELELSELLTVRRARKRGSATVLTVVLAGETRRGAAAQQLLFELLRESHDDYEATVDFKQEDIESVVGMRSGDRRKVISAWLRLERWVLAAKKASEQVRVATNRMLAARAAREGVTGLLTNVEEKDGKEHLANVSAAIVELRYQLNAANAELATLESPAVLAARFRELNSLRAQVAEIKPRLKQKPDVQVRSDAAQEELATKRAESAAADKRVRELNRIKAEGFDGTCPVTCGKCPVASDVSVEVERSKTLFKSAVTAQLDAQHRLNQVLVPARQLGDQLASLERDAGTYATAVQRGKALADLVSGKSAEDVTTLQLAHQELGDKRQELSAALEQAVRTETECKGLLQGAEQASRRQVQCDEELAAAETDVRVTALMMKALGPTGVPARIARAHVSRLEASANELLADCGLSLEFGWERSTKDLEPTCSECGYVYVGQRDKACPSCNGARGAKMSEELEILVDDGSGEVEDVRSKSGGARILVASALRLSAAAMLRTVRDTPIAWATIDEPFGPLDAENRETLAQIFSGMLGAVGLEQAFVVSHDVALLDRMPHRLVIERGEECSTLRLEVS